MAIWLGALTVLALVAFASAQVDAGVKPGLQVFGRTRGRTSYCVLVVFLGLLLATVRAGIN